MKKNSLALICVLLLSLLLAAFAGCTDEPASSADDTSAATTDTSSETPEQKISITVKVVHGDGSQKSFVIETSEKTLLGALMQENLVEGDDSSPTGFYITTVDGETADYSANQSWWCLSSNGEMLMTGAGTTMISDGQNYEITYTIG